jgi:hypothetical protein
METPETPLGKKRRSHAQLWNDDLFRNRILLLAEKKGIGVRDAMREVGFTSDYAYRQMDMRNSNQLMVLANYFGVSPGYLAGWEDKDYGAIQYNAARLRALERGVAALQSRENRQAAEYREWLGNIILEMVKLAQQGAGDAYNIAERVLMATGADGVHSSRCTAAPSGADVTSSAGDGN